MEENVKWNGRLSGEGVLAFEWYLVMDVSEEVEVGTETVCESESCSHAKESGGEVETSSSLRWENEHLWKLWILNDDAVETVTRTAGEVGPASIS